MKVLALSLLVACACTSAPSVREDVLTFDVLFATMPARVAERLVAAGGDATMEIERLARSGSEVAIVTRPRLTLFDGQRGEVAVSNEVAFVSDFEVRDGIADPVVGTLQEGWWIDLLPAPVEGGVDVQLEMRQATMRRPMRTETRMLAGTEAQVTVEVPEVDNRSVRRRVTLRPHESQLLRLSPTPDEPRAVVGVVRYRAG